MAGESQGTIRELLRVSVPQDEVVTKYKAAGEIANSAFNAFFKNCWVVFKRGVLVVNGSVVCWGAEVMAEVVSNVKPGAKIVDLCKLGDNMIERETGAVFNKKKDPKTGEKIEKGIGFPTCISPNEKVGHFTPKDASSEVTLKEGDVAKVDLGVHIDGYIAMGADTVVVQSEGEGGGGAAVEGRAADVIECTEKALEVALRLFRPGRKTSEVPAVLERIAEDYNCSVVEGVMSHQMKRFVADANKVVLNKQTSEMKTEDATFEEFEVYAIDIVMSTGDGRTRVRLHPSLSFCLFGWLTLLLLW